MPLARRASLISYHNHAQSDAHWYPADIAYNGQKIIGLVEIYTDLDLQSSICDNSPFVGFAWGPESCWLPPRASLLAAR